jgi:hypothetical protein
VEIAVNGCLENGYYLVQRRPRPEILLPLAGLHDSNVVSLVALHADVVREPARKPRRINDAAIYFAGWCATALTLSHMEFAATVAVLAAQRQLGKRRIKIVAARPATGCGRPLWQPMHCSRIGRLKP